MKSFCKSCVLFFIANITVIFVAFFIDYLFGQEAGALTAGIGLLLLWIYFLYLIIRFLKRLCNLKKSHQIEQLEKQTSCVVKKEPHVSNHRSTQKQNRLSPSSMKKKKDIIKFLYEDYHGNLTNRKVEVISVSGQKFDAWCYSRKAIRTFKIDNIIGLVDVNGESMLIETYLESKGFQRKKPTSKKQIQSGNSQLEVCFTGFKKSDKQRLETVAKENDFFIRTTVTKNLNFLITGENAGPTKITQAKNNGVVILDENGFLNMIETGEIPEAGIKFLETDLSNKIITFDGNFKSDINIIKAKTRKCGAYIIAKVSAQTDILVAGNDATKKLTTAFELGINIFSEDEFLILLDELLKDNQEDILQ